MFVRRVTELSSAPDENRVFDWVGGDSFLDKAGTYTTLDVTIGYLTSRLLKNENTSSNTPSIFFRRRDLTRACGITTNH